MIAVGIFLVLMAASLTVTMHVQPQYEVEAYKKFLRAKGEKLDLNEVLPPSVPPESNSVDAVEDAFRLFGSGPAKIPDAMRMVAPGKALIGWNQPDVRGYASGDFTNTWDEFAREIEVNRPAIELLRQVLDRPELDFQLDYKRGFAIWMPHLISLKRSAQKLDATAIYDLHNGECGAAATNILTLLAIVHKSAPDGLLISHLVRIAMTSIAVTPTWEFLQAANDTDAQLAAVQKGWEQTGFLSDAENAFVMERARASAEIQKSRDSHEGFIGMFNMGTSPSGSSSTPGDWNWPEMLDNFTRGSRFAVGEVLWRSSWNYSDELGMLKSDQVILETLRTMRTNNSQFYKLDYDLMVSRLSSLGLTNASKAIFRVLNIPDWGAFFGDETSLGNAVAKTLQIETARRVVVAAIALKRFQLKHGKWPETLGELIPEFLPSVPIDPYDGKPLKYHPNSDGTFLLYSVGEDGKDDGGDPTNAASSGSSLYWQLPTARDWVWPQPASPAEVQSFYEHPPK